MGEWQLLRAYEEQLLRTRTDLYELGVVRLGVAGRQLVEHLRHDPEVPLHQRHLATQLLLLETEGLTTG